MQPKGLCDIKEPDKITNKLARNGWSITKLSIGDYATGEFIFERKTPNDFFATINDKRYKFQLAKMMSQEERSLVYIIEGNIKDGFYKTRAGDTKPVYDPMRSKIYTGAISSLMAKYGISVIQSINQNMTAELLIKFAEKHREPVEFDLFDLIESDIDGIGAKRLLDVATHISAKSGMPWNLMDEMDKIEWLKVYKSTKAFNIPGVGPKSLDKLILYFEEGVIA